MPQVVVDQGTLRIVGQQPPLGKTDDRGFSVGLPAIDGLLAHRTLSYGAVHEVLGDATGVPSFFAALLARAALRKGAIVWCDPERKIYPPALATVGLPLERLFLLRCDEPWATAECMRCRAVDVTVVAAPGTLAKLSRLDARRLQLAAERGGGIGILLRRLGRSASASHYAAATRWLVRPVPGTPTSQRWSVRLLHGHGGLFDKTVLLEVSRDNNHSVRAFEQLADRPASPQTARRATA